MPVSIKEGSKVVTALDNCDRPIIYSHNLCDKTTWYQESTRVTGETLDVIADTDNKQFQADYTYWVDLTHGKLSDEDDFSSTYLPVIKVDGVTKTEATPFGSGTDGDFTIDYAAGKVVFHNSVTGTVTADYSYAGSSKFTITPGTGKVLEILKAEAQIASNIDLKDTTQYHVYVGEAAVKSKKYKTIDDFINEANKSSPVISAFGGSSRGIATGRIIFNWDYLARTDLRDSLSMTVVLELANDTEHGGDKAIVAFYCHSETEEGA